MAGFLDFLRPNQSSIGNILHNLSKISKFGMEYDDMIIKNSQAIGKSESAFSNDSGAGFTKNDAFYYTLSYQDTKIKKYIAYFDNEYIEKRNFLRKFSLNGEIEFILDIISDECITYDNKNYFAKPRIKNMDIKDNIKDKIFDEYDRIYNIFGFQNSLIAWQYFKQFLIDGFLAFEIIYDAKGKEIIGFKEIDATSLQPATEKIGENEYKQFWIQYPKNPEMTRKLTNEQIIYISYAKGNSVSRISYVERLIRSYNILKLMENSRIIWNVMNSSYRLKFIIPVGSQSPQKAMQTLGQIMSKYKEDISMNDASGELTINGKPKIQFYKNYLFPDQEGVTPSIESLNPSGPDFNVMDNVVYFLNKLKMDSKLPTSRFASRSSSPVNYQMDISQLERDEIRFEKFLRRLRSIYQEILIKPLYIQMCLHNNELSKDLDFKSNIGLDFHRENMFEKLIELANIEKRAELITGLAEFKINDDGNEISYFNADFLVKRFLNLTPDQIEENERYKKNEGNDKNDKNDKNKKGESTEKDSFSGESLPGGESPEI